MKLGAVIVPATTLLDAQRSCRPLRARPRASRHRRRRRRARSSPICRATTRASSSAGAVPGWTAYRGRLRGAGAASRPTARRAPTIRCCFISRPARRRRRSSCCTAIRAIRSGTCRRCTGSGLRPGDVHLNISSPGWAKHAWSCFFAPWNAQATVFIVNQRRFNARGLARHDRALRRHHLLRAADGVAHADPGGSGRLAGAHAGTRSAPASRSIPRSSSGCKTAWGLTIRDGYGQTETTALGRQYAGAEGQARLDGPAAAGLSRRAARCGRRARRGRRDLPHLAAAADRADAGLSGRRRRRRADRQARSIAPAMSPRSMTTAI